MSDSKSLAVRTVRMTVEITHIDLIGMRVTLQYRMIVNDKVIQIGSESLSWKLKDTLSQTYCFTVDEQELLELAEKRRTSRDFNQNGVLPGAGAV